MEAKEEFIYKSKNNHCIHKSGRDIKASQYGYQIKCSECGEVLESGGA